MVENIENVEKHISVLSNACEITRRNIESVINILLKDTKENIFQSKRMYFIEKSRECLEQNLENLEKLSQKIKNLLLEN